MPVSILSAAASGIVKIALGISPSNLAASALVNLSVGGIIGLVILPLGFIILILLEYNVRARKGNDNEELPAVELGGKPHRKKGPIP